MIDLADLVTSFAQLLKPSEGNNIRLDTWIGSTAAADLPHLHAFTRGLAQDRATVDAGLTLPYHNGGTEASTPRPRGSCAKCIAEPAFSLLRHRILLG